MYWQKGNDDYFPSNYSQYLGNDDQVFWGLAAMTAAELNFPQENNQPSWLSLAQGVFNTQAVRWDTSTCDGGLRWQIWPYQAGYNIKNAISNGGLFQLSARLARYTNNQTYSDWANKIWDWSATTPLLKESTWTIADTTTTEAQCHDHGDLQWTYNYGTYLSGAAYMYNMVSNSENQGQHAHPFRHKWRRRSNTLTSSVHMQTNGDPKWKTGLDGLLGTTFREFFPSKYGGEIMSEVACESLMTCDRNQDCFKGFLSSWLAFMTTIVPYTAPEIIPKLQASAIAAGKQCSGGANKTLCGRRWYQPTFDGTSSLEEEMSALSLFSSNLVVFEEHVTPLTAQTGGTSKSNPAAGTSEPHRSLRPITAADRAGAGILTATFLALWGAIIYWMLRG